MEEDDKLLAIGSKSHYRKQKISPLPVSSDACCLRLPALTFSASLCVSSIHTCRFGQLKAWQGLGLGRGRGPVKLAKVNFKRYLERLCHPDKL